MSDREFENYLALLTRLLRLNRQQCETLSAELRSHMEDRLDELTSRGMPHEDAVRQALAEFGDAAGLAHQFSVVSVQRKRRWIVRLKTFSLAAAVLIAVGLIAFWPGHNAAPGIATVVAQPQIAPAQSVPATVKEIQAGSQLGKRKSASARIEDELNKTTTIDVVEMPLKDVMLYLSETHKMPIALKQKFLEEAHIPIDTPITKSIRGVRLSTALDIILEDLELTYYFNEVLFITTPKDAQFRAEVRIYDCRDILAMPTPDVSNPATLPPGGDDRGFARRAKTESERRAEQLIQIIKTNIDQDTWFDGGTSYRVGSISEFNGLVVVTQTAQTHRRIEHLLSMLREAAGLDLTKAALVVR